ncbi:MAG: ABC transporter permease [Polyangiaceae bacterium]|nr:ABC transporter permease [Polyangiaceae bacterium]
MNDTENLYRPPASAESAEDVARLSRSEWRYVAKVFAIATVATSIFWGVTLTLQTTYALKAFSAEGRVAGIVFVSALREMGRVAVGFAACIALVLLVHRRMDADIRPPAGGIFLPVMVVLPLAAPIAGLIMCVTSLCFLLVGFEQPFALCWDAIRSTLVYQDPLLGMLSATAQTFVFGALATEIARRIARYEGWTILKILIISLVMGFFSQIATSVSWYALYHDDPALIP